MPFFVVYRQRRFIGRRVDLFLIVGQFVQIRSERDYIFFIHIRAERNGCIHRGFGFIFVRDAVVLKRGGKVVFRNIHHRRGIPIAVKSEPRYIEVNLIVAVRNVLKFYKPFNVHAV